MARRSRPSLKSSSRSGPGPWTKAAMIFGIICIIFFIGGLVTYAQFFNETIEIDKATGCPNEGPISRTVILIDQTDTFSPVHQIDIRNQFVEYKKGVPRYGELVVYSIRPSLKGPPTLVIRACNPGNKDDARSLVESTSKMVERWVRDFDTPIKAVMKDVLKPMSSKTSPIIETIQAVVVSEFGPPNMNNRGKKYDVDRFLQSPAYNKLSADLRDVDVDLLYLYRDTKSAHQNSKHRDFWMRLIQEQGGSVRRFYKVSG
jgi:hypothetical protein